MRRRALRTGALALAVLAAGAPPAAARIRAPVVNRFTVAPVEATAPALPTVVLRIDQRGARTVRARLTAIPHDTSTRTVRVDLGRIVVGHSLQVTWPQAASLAPGTWTVRLHAVGARGRVLARTPRRPGKADITITAGGDDPAGLYDPPDTFVPLAPSAGAGVFPVAGPHTYGDGFGAARDGHSHQGVDVLAAEGVRVVAPVAAAVVKTAYQASGAGYYVVIDATDGRSYFFAHCQAGSIAVAAGATVAAGGALCRVGHTGGASGPHLHFEAWEHGWRTTSASRPIDPLALLRRWDAAAR